MSKNTLSIVLVAIVFLIAGVLIAVLLGSGDESISQEEARQIAENTSGTQAVVIQQVVDSSVGTQIAGALPAQPVSQEEARQIAENASGTQAVMMQQIVDNSVGTQIAAALPNPPVSQEEVQQIANNASGTQVAMMQDIVDNSVGTQIAVALVPTQTVVPPTPTVIPQADAADDDPFVGPEDAPVVLVEFSDFQCGFCNRFAEETLPQILEAYPDQVKFVYRDFTIFGEESVSAAEAAQCANDQDEFLAMHNRIFANHDDANRLPLTEDTLVSFADELGLDTDTFSECLTGDKYRQEVLDDYSAAVAYGLQGTPGFIINGVVYPFGAQPFGTFQQIIDAELAKAN